MPVWHEKTKDARESGQLVALGVIQEQHPQRCRLFAQWQGFEWPILHDPVNQLRAQAVPYFIAIDEAGVVIDNNLQVEEFGDFLRRPAPDLSVQATAPSIRAPKITRLNEAAQQEPSALAFNALADHRILWRSEKELDRAINDYQRAIELNPQYAPAHFGLGVALRMRFDSEYRQKSDFQRAIDSWGQALEIDPNHYIYRRRIQQYGPRLTKPYPFYDWVTTAQRELEERGETPVQLKVAPSGAEIAHPRKEMTPEPSVAEPDPQGRIHRDSRGLIQVQTVVVPRSVKPGETLRIHLELTPSESAHWNNEVEPLKLWIDLPEGWETDGRLLQSESPATAESTETRRFEFEIQSSESSTVKEIKAYALYYVCEEKGGQCLYLRQDIRIPFRFRAK